MAYTTAFKDIVFIEGDHPQAVRKNKAKVNLSGIGAQMKNLNDVKNKLCAQAKLFSCNCVLDFKYGQKTSWFAFDDVKYFGSGVLANLPEKTYLELLNKNYTK